MGTHHQSPVKHTVKKRTGLDGLWKLGRRVNKLVLSWKFLGDLHEEGIGVNEVEAQAWVRTVNCEAKKGRNVKDGKRGWHS